MVTELNDLTQSFVAVFGEWRHTEDMPEALQRILDSAAARVRQKKWSAVITRQEMVKVLSALEETHKLVDAAKADVTEEEMGDITGLPIVSSVQDSEEAQQKREEQKQAAIDVQHERKRKKQKWAGR